MQPYIYKITDLRNDNQYVGQHNGRHKKYFTGSKIIRRAIKLHGKKLFKKEIIVQGDFNQILLNELEKHYIRLFGTRAPFGYNLTDGGDTLEGFKHSEESIKKIKFIANNRSKETLEKMRIGKIGIFPINQKPVDQYSKNGKFIKTWPSIQQAAKGTNSHKASIYLSANRIDGNRTSGGFIWVYKGKIPEPIKQKEVCQFTKNGAFVRKWNSATQAAKELKVNVSNILSVLNNCKYAKSAYGFIWRYVEKGVNLET